MIFQQLRCVVDAVPVAENKFYLLFWKIKSLYQFNTPVEILLRVSQWNQDGDILVPVIWIGNRNLGNLLPVYGIKMNTVFGVFCCFQMINNVSKFTPQAAQ